MSASQSARISSSVLYLPTLTLIVVSASSLLSPKPTRADEIFLECDEQADPADTQIPFPDRKLSIVSLLMLGKVTLMT